MWGLFHKPLNKDPVIKQPGFNGLTWQFCKRDLFWDGLNEIVEKLSDLQLTNFDNWVG